MTQDWRTLTREQLDWAYDQRQHAANMQAVLTELAQAGEATQARLKQRHQRIAYGADPVTRMDVYANGSPDAPVLFFIHGGAWKSGQARDYAFFVEWVLQAGLDVVIPDFSAVQDVGGDLTVLQRQLSQALTQVLNTLERKGLRAATRGRGLWNEKTRQGAGTGGGIASPVTEVSFDARQWWDDGWKTSDGLFTIPMPKKITMRDANNAEVVFEFANPAPVPAP